MLRLLANENLPRALVAALRRLGHDVRWIAETTPGLPDAEVLRLAAEEQRICVTQDKDFGELAARWPAMATCGVILLRLPSWPVEEAASRTAAILHGREDWAGHFSVIEPGRIRMRRIAGEG